jgi:hypothetical protein
MDAHEITEFQRNPSHEKRLSSISSGVKTGKQGKVRHLLPSKGRKSGKVRHLDLFI